MSSLIDQINLVTMKEIYPSLIKDLFFTKQSAFSRFVQGKNPNFKFGFSGFVPANEVKENVQERMFFISIFDSSSEYVYTNVCESCSEELNTKILDIEEKRFAVCQFCFNYLKGQGILN